MKQATVMKQTTALLAKPPLPRPTLRRLCHGTPTAPTAPSDIRDDWLLASHASPSREPIVDTHCHLSKTFAAHQRTSAAPPSLASFVQGLYSRSGGGDPREVGTPRGPYRGTVVDVWCEAPVLTEQLSRMLVEVEGNSWTGVDYRFVIGVHPHRASDYDGGAPERAIRMMAGHPRNVGIGEIGLDYHRMRSPAEVQRGVFARQLRLAVELGKPVTVHTREADADCLEILMRELPRDWKIHVHCFTDAPDFAEQLLAQFPNLFIGITGAITAPPNRNTVGALRLLAAAAYRSSQRHRYLLETDSPHMSPHNLVDRSTGQRFPVSHSGMIPWIAAFVADALTKAGWPHTADEVMRQSARNAREMYGLPEA